MKSIRTAAAGMVLLLFATGCGILDGVGQTVNFAAETTSYMQSLQQFGQEMSAMAEQAAADAEAKADLQRRLQEMKETIANYEGVAVPEYAKELHQSIVQYNEKLQEGLDQALANIEQGKAALESTGIPETVGKLNELLNQLNQLAP